MTDFLVKNYLLARSVNRLANGRFLSLDGPTLCAKARNRTALHDFGDPGIENRLSVLADSIEREANLHSVGRFLARMHLLDLLETRLVLMNRWKSNPPSTSITRPIFITGMPRSGSTFLHELLSQDLNVRPPRVWEVMFPLAAIGNDQRRVRRSIQKTAFRLWCFRRLARNIDCICPLRANAPHECVAIHSYTLLSHEFLIMFRIPSYRAFLAAADARLAYDWQKQFLQMLQAQQGAATWVLKSPDHVFGLGALFTAFPDALVIQTHRAPLEVLRSCIRMTEALQRTFARSEPIDQISTREAEALAEGMDHAIDFRDNHPELAAQFLDVSYHELISHPLGTVKRLYAQMGSSMSSGTVQRIERLACTRGRYRQPPHMTLRQLGLDTQAEKRRFQRYCQRFAVPQN